jgi:mannose-6-phosphate isomerase
MAEVFAGGGVKFGPQDMTFVSKPWGYELWITNNDLYCGKILFIKAGHSCSLHYHKVKDEVLYVQTGVLRFHHTTLLEGDETRVNIVRTERLGAGEAFHVSPGFVHRMEAIEDTTIIEFSTQHFDSDSYRIPEGPEEEDVCLDS